MRVSIKFSSVKISHYATLDPTQISDNHKIGRQASTKIDKTMTCAGNFGKLSKILVGLCICKVLMSLLWNIKQQEAQAISHFLGLQTPWFLLQNSTPTSPRSTPKSGRSFLIFRHKYGHKIFVRNLLPIQILLPCCWILSSHLTWLGKRLQSCRTNPYYAPICKVPSNRRWGWCTASIVRSQKVE